MKKSKQLLKILSLIVRVAFANPIRWIRIKLIKWVFRLRSKLRKESLREAIVNADKINAKTGRKAMVVFNNWSGKFEPLQKRHLKNMSRRNKTKSSKTSERSKKKPRVLTPDRIDQIEKRSLYVASKRKAV